jgi:magnesium-transporting ATPase (P-type)
MKNLKDKMSAKKVKTEAILEREGRQLLRLQVLLDVIFALILWRIFQLLPNVTGPGDEASLLQALSAQRNVYLVIFVAIVLTIVYWVQNNSLFGNLDRTDAKHATLSILQIFTLLIYLRAVRWGIDIGPTTLTLGLQSIFLALAGFLAGLGWAYARKNRRLLSDAISDEEARDQQIGILAEPISAVISLPFAWVGPWAWEVSWFVYPLAAWLLKRHRVRR